MKILLILTITLLSQNIIASSKHAGIVVKKRGNVLLLTNASKTAEGKSPRIKLAETGLYYTETKVRPGTKISNGDILWTKDKKAKARVVFKNGDQFNVAPGTQYEIKWERPKGVAKTAATVNLIYGSIRGIISPKGPRNNLKVKTKNAVMGVRGTDFNFKKVGTSGNTLVSVIRGKVKVSPVEKGKIENKKTVEVKSSQSANVYSDKFLAEEYEAKAKKMKLKLKMKKPKKRIFLSDTSKKDLLRIQRDSHIIQTKADLPESKEIKKEIRQLEKQATKVTLDDIKTYQPEVYKELKKTKIKSVAQLNTMVIKKAYQKAPAKPDKMGFEVVEEDLNEDEYEKYFAPEVKRQRKAGQ